MRCCDKIRITSESWTQAYAKEMLGTYERLTDSALGDTAYKKIGSTDMKIQYYLAGSKNQGWNVS